MGMSASQVRFLSLQSRKNNIGLNLMTLSNRRTALSRDMKRVAANYNNAMNQKLLKWTNDSGMTYNDINYDLLMKPNAMNSTLPYIVTDAQGRVVLDDNKIVLDGEVTDVSYRDLATMISTYSGFHNSASHYDNLSGIVGDNYSLENPPVWFEDIGDGVQELKVNSTGVTGGVANEENPYQIVSSTTNMQAGSLQYDVMQKLGLLTTNEVNEIKDIMVDLYGNKVDGEGPYPVACLMGQYYFTCAKLEAYNALQNEVKNYEIAGLANNCSYTGDAFDTKTLKDVVRKIDNTNTSSVTFNLNSDTNNDCAKQLLEKIDFSANNDYNNDHAGIYNSLIKNETPGNYVTYEVNANTNNIKFTFKDTESIKSILLNNKITNASNYNDPDSFQSGNIKEVCNGISWYDIFSSTSNGNTNSFYSLDLYNDSNDCCTIGDVWDKVQPRLNNFITDLATLVKTKLSMPDETAANNAAKATYAVFRGYLCDNSWTESDCGDVISISDQNDNTYDQTVNDSVWNSYKNNLISRRSYSGFRYNTEITVNPTNIMNVFFTFYNAYTSNETIKDSPNFYKYSGNADDNIRQNNKAATSLRYDVANEINIGSNGCKGIITSKKDYGSYNEVLVLVKNIGEPFEYDNTKYNNVTYTTYKLYERGDNYSINPNENIPVNNNFSNATKISEVVETYKVDGNNAIAGGILKQDTLKYVDGNLDSVVRARKYDGENWWYATIKEATNYDNNSRKDMSNNVDYAKWSECNSNGYLVSDRRWERGVKMYIYDVDGNITEARISNEKVESGTAYVGTLANGLAHNDYYNHYVYDKFINKIDIQDEIDALETNKTDLMTQIEEAKASLNTLFTSKQSKIMDYFNALFKMISERGWVYDENVNNKTNPSASQQYLNAKLQNNLFFITEVESVNGEDFDYATKVVNNVSRVIEIYDEDASNVALSQYEAEKADITAKEKVIDMRISKLEAEEEAITTEMDSLKTIINDNVQNTFKIFS